MHLFHKSLWESAALSGTGYERIYIGEHLLITGIHVKYEYRNIAGNLFGNTGCTKDMGGNYGQIKGILHQL